MKKLTKDNYLITLILIFIPLLFIILPSWINDSNTVVETIAFIFITAIVIITNYRVILFIFNRYPMFLETGIFKNKLITFIIGAILLSTMIGVYIVIFNSIPIQEPLINRGITLLLAYPTLFVLILLIYSFIKNVFSGEKESLLFVSSFSILAVLIIMILLSP